MRKQLTLNQYLNAESKLPVLGKVNSKTYVNKNKAKKNHLQKFTFAHEAITSAASEKGSHQISNSKKFNSSKTINTEKFPE
jgi:hypothetical protein